jgi:predicted phosphoadenosine phosphosulfate sulfurtransferase
MARTTRKIALDVDVLTAARERIAWTFDTFERVYVSGPSGKDSGVVMHLAAAEARRRGRKLGVLYIDLEAQYKATIEYVAAMFELYADVIDPHWVALPLRLRNAVSMLEPYWICWDPEARYNWVRTKPIGSISDPSHFPFFRPPYRDQDGVACAMEFEEFVEEFGDWYGDDRPCACLVGIRTDESLNRWRSIAKDRASRVHGRPWTARKGVWTCNVYPIYDWQTEDLWTFVAREGLPYSRIYDLMHSAGLTLHQMRICQPYGDDQRKGLDLFHVLEPETWERVVARVSGANAGALYCREAGNILGNRKAELPSGHTWETYADLLLGSLPAHERDHYEDKIAVFLKWYMKRGYPDGIPDEADPKDEAARRVPSWRRICKVILKNDRICKGLSFAQQGSRKEQKEKYKDLMKRRRQQWGVI